MADNGGTPPGSHGFFAAWLLLHEKADDWLKGAVARARETPSETRRDYQAFLLEVDREKDALKAVFADALVNEFRHAGFVHRKDADDLRAEVEALRRRIAGLEERLDRADGDGK